MAFKKLLVPVTGRAPDAAALACALAAAKRFDAHLVAQFTHADVREAIPFGELPLSPDFVQDLIETAAGVEKAAHAAAKKALEDAAAAAGAAVLPAPCRGFGVSFTETTGLLSETLVRASLLCDLAVFPSLRDRAVPDVPEAFARVLIKAACPLLLSPPAPRETLGRRIAVGWDNGIACARALMAALPFLALAERVVLISVRSGTSDLSPEGPVAYLALHGIDAHARIVAAEGRKVGEVLLAAAEEESCDLLVAGGYSRGRLTEALFGGVTEHLLARADLPVFMAH